MSNFQGLTTERLNKLINETQQTLDELRHEVGRREQVQKQNEILDLDSHMKSAELSLTTIRNFINYLVEGSRKN